MKLGCFDRRKFESAAVINPCVDFLGSCTEEVVSMANRGAF